jgi:predicted ATPase
MFADMVGFTAAMQVDEQSALESRDRYRSAVERLHDEFAGTIIQYYGDGTLSIFSNSVDAVRCAVAIQQTLSEAPAVPVRVGLHVGDVVVEEHGLLGDAVNVASRIESFGQPRAVLLSDSVQDLVKNQPDLTLVSLGEFHLDNVARPFGIFAVDSDGLTIPNVESMAGKGRRITDAASRSNLPVQVTSFVGRVQESAELEKLIRGSRLVTVTGAGGCGKSRLAVKVAAEVLDEYPDGVWLVELAPLSDGLLVSSTMAGVLGVREQPGADTLEILTGHLDQKNLLLVVDNCEHLIEPVADMIAHLLTHTTGVRVLATSRQPIDIRGEAVYHLPTLTVPDEDATWETLTHTDSVRLFSERAEAARQGFRVTNDNGNAVASICRHLDGIPLALELAASRTRALTPPEIDRRLVDRFQFLTTGTRDDIDHHRTLEATIDWSYQLLTGDQQVVFARLAVFVGSFTIEAAEQVCSDDPLPPGRVANGVVALVDQSLLEVDEDASSTRYTMLETIRDYAEARLGEAGNRATVQQGHADYYRQLVAESDEQQWGSEESYWLDRLDDEWPNMRRAMQWHLDEGQTRLGQMMAGSLRSFFLRRYHQTEGVEWLRQFVEADQTPCIERAHALMGLLVLTYRGEYYHLWDEAIELFRRFGSKKELAGILNNAAYVAMEDFGDWEAARPWLTEAVELYREMSDSQGLWATLDSCAMLAAAGDNDVARAIELEEESLHWARRLDSPEAVANSLRSLGAYRRHAGDLAGATRAIEEAGLEESKLGAKHSGAGMTELFRASVELDRGETQAAISHLVEFDRVIQPLRQDDVLWSDRRRPLLEWSRVAIALGRHDVAATLLAANEEHGRTHTEPTWPPYLAELEQTLTAAREQLEEGSFETAWADGRGMTADEALDCATDELL